MIKLHLLCLLALVVILGTAAAPVGAVTLPFIDDFSVPPHVNGAPDPDWDVIEGNWYVQDGYYTSAAGTGPWPFSMVKDIDPVEVKLYVEGFPLNGGLAVRFQDPQNHLVLHGYGIWLRMYGNVYSNPGTVTGWIGGPAPSSTDRIRYKATVLANKVYGREEVIATGAYKEFTVAIPSTTWTRVGLLEWDGGQLWDNFQATDIDRGNLEGHITDAQTGSPIVGATVELVDLGYSTTSGDGGYYLLSNVPASYPVPLKASASGYAAKEQSVTVQANATTTVDLALDSPTTLPFTDTFSGPGHVNGEPDPDWDVMVGNWWVQDGYYTSAAGAGPWPVSVVKGLDMSEGVLSVEGYRYNCGIAVRYKDADNLLILNATGSWVMMKGGVFSNPGTSSGWIGGPAPARTDRVLMRAAVMGDQVYGHLEVMSTGAYMDLQVPLPSPTWTRVGLFCYEAGQQWDNFQAYALQSGPVSGFVTDASTGSGIGGAYVELVGTSYSATTLSDGSYTISDVPAGSYTLRASKTGYVPNTTAVTPANWTGNVKLSPFVGLDWARTAIATSNDGVPSNANDGSPTTAWSASSGYFQTGDWLQLAWSDTLTIKSILIDSAGPHPDYTVQASMDGAAWTDLQHVTSSESGDHTHWMETVQLSSPATLKYLRIVLNDVDWYGCKFWSVECYKPAGSAAGFVKDSMGIGVSGATVYAYESINNVRGTARFVAEGVTGVGGAYSLPVPEGPVMVTACVPGNLSVSSSGVSVTSGSTTNVPNLAVGQAPATQQFADNFDDNQPELRWDFRLGAWGSDGGGRLAATDFLDYNFATVKGQSLGDCVVEADIFGVASGVVARYKDNNNMLVFQYRLAESLRLSEVHSAVWTARANTTVQVNSKNLRISVVAVGNKAQGFISDGYNVYWTPVVTLTYLLAPGGVGLYGSWDQTPHYFDNFAAHKGAGAATVETVGDAKKAGPGWAGRLKGVVTAVFADYDRFFVEDRDRACAFEVAPLPAQTPQVGQEVIVLGTVLDDGALRQSDVAPTGQNINLGPLGVNNRDMVGAVGNAGVANLDLLVTNWGKVLDTPIALPDGTTIFHISDGTASQAFMVDVPSNVLFWDAFSGPRHENGLPDPDWDVVAGNWFVQNGYYTSDPGVAAWPEAAVKNLSVAECILSVEGRNLNCGPIVRYKDQSNLMILHPWVTQFLVVQSGNVSYVGSSTGWVGGPAPASGDRLRFQATIQGGQVVGRFEVVATGANCQVTYPVPDPSWTRVGLMEWDGGQEWDNFLVTTLQPASSVPRDAVQVAIPPSVVGTPSISQGDYVTVVGIAHEGMVLTGRVITNSIRGIVARDAAGLKIVSP